MSVQIQREKKNFLSSRMAVSLNDAWNDFIVPSHDNPIQRSNEPPTQTPPEPVISAKIVKEDSNEKLTRLMENEKALHSTFRENIKLMENMVENMAELRKEEAKRCTMYMILGAILFAFLFIYIDRLQSKIQNLAYNIRHNSMRHNEHVMRSLNSEPFQWYP